MKILTLNPPFLKKYSRQSRSPCVTKGGTFYYPYFLAYATGALEKTNFKVKLVDAVANEWSHNDTVRFAKRFKPDLVVLDTSTPSIFNDVEVGEKIKHSLPNTHLSLGGTHVTNLPQETLEMSKSIDSIIRGEYDATVIDLAEKVEREKTLKSVDGLSLRKNGKIIHNKPRELIEDLDNLPFVSEVYLRHFGREGIKKYFYASVRWPQVTILTARGCKYNCSFCNIPFKRSYRARSSENVVEEFEYIQNELPFVKEVMIEDDTFPMDKKRTIELCDLMIKREINLTWSCNARVNSDFETLKKMREANARLLCVLPETFIFTAKGFKKIKEIKPGDGVLTHRNLFRRVTKVFRREYNGKVIKIKPFYLPSFILTPEHPIFFLKKSYITCKKINGICHPYHTSYKCEKCTKKKYIDVISLAAWVPAKDVSKGFLFVPIPDEVKEKESIKISDILTQHDLQIVNLNKIEKLRKGGSSLKQISCKLNLPMTMLGKYFDSRYKTAMKKIKIKNIDWVKISGDHAFIKNEIPINKDFCLLAGYFSAEGSLLFSKKKGTYRVTFTFSDKEEKYSREVFQLLIKLFGVKPSLIKSKNKREVSVFSKTLAYLFLSLFGKDSINRKVPPFFLFLQLQKQKAFLKGLLRGDASPKKNKDGKLTKISLIIASKTLHMQVILLLLRLGILSSTYTTSGSKRMFYGINIEGYDELKKLENVFELPIYKGKFRQKRGIRIDNFLIVPVRSVDTIYYSGNVMNLEVEKDESYTGNMVLVHNCVGFESATQNILNNIHKGTTKQMQLDFMKKTRKLGILVNGCFILGLPNDTHETMRATIEMAKELNPDTAQFYPLMVYPGTEAYEWVRKNDYLETTDFRKWITKEGWHRTTINRPDLSSKELMEWCDRARREYYMRPKYLIHKLFQSVTSLEEMKRNTIGFKTFSAWLYDSIFGKGGSI